MTSSRFVESAGTQNPGVSNFRWGATAHVSTFALPKGYLVEGHPGAWVAFAQLSEPRLQRANRWKEYRTGREAKLNVRTDYQNDLRESFKRHTAHIIIKKDGASIWQALMLITQRDARLVRLCNKSQRV